MSFFQWTRTVIRDLFRRDRFEREMREELETFLEMDTQARQRSGADAAEARRSARAHFGSPEASKDALRDTRFGSLVESIARDVRHAVRQLWRSPGFTTAAVLTIALGAFPLAATAAFTNWLFFAPAPGVTGAAGLVRISLISVDDSGDRDEARVSALNLADLAVRVRTVSALAGRAGRSASIAVPDVDALRVGVTFVSQGYFEVLGMRMAAGRAFTPDEDVEPGGQPVAILGHALARRLFGEAERAPGQRVLINGVDFRVVGVAPGGFRDLKNDEYTELWLPAATSLRTWHVPPDEWTIDRRRSAFDELLGRLAPGTGIDNARVELTAAVRALAAAWPVENDDLTRAEVIVEAQPGMAFTNANTRDPMVLMITVFASAAALLLVLAAANVGNLMLFRAARRRSEIALRAALGASRLRLLRAHLIEVLLLSFTGGVVGLALVLLAGKLLDGVIVPDGGFLELPIDWRVTGLVLAGAVIMGLIVGGVPAMLRTSSSGLASGVRRIGHGGGHRLRSALSVAQLAVSLALLVGALLLFSTVRELLGEDLGFDPARVTSGGVMVRDHGYDDPRALVFFRAVLEHLEASGVVEAASISTGAPGSGAGGERARIALPGGTAEQSVTVVLNSVSGDYFRTIGLPILHGRAFSSAEAFSLPDGSCGPVIVSESLATRLFETGPALDRTLDRPGFASNCRVVGVVPDVRGRPGADWEQTLYQPLGRGALWRNVVLVRERSPEPSPSAALRAAVASVDPAVPLNLVRTLAESREFGLSNRRIMAGALGFVSVLGLLMAAVGLYGLVAETVADRSREFAVRMAIGAGPREILVAVMGRAVGLAAFGLAGGLVLAAGLAQLLRSQIFGVSLLDPAVLTGAGSLLTAVVLFASLVPAVRATRTNPVDVLRTE